ncbi:sulfurtransferase [[Eubacterium] cellulosolvens]
MEKSSGILVDTSWLYEHYEYPNLKIMEIDTPPLIRLINRYIPNSLLIDWKNDLWHKTKRDFVVGADFKRLMESLGISNKDTIVCCSTIKQFATYAYWILKYNNHKDVRLLDGGPEKWISEGNPVTDKPYRLNEYDKSKYEINDIDSKIRVFRDYVLQSLQRNDIILLDARSPEEYEGNLINVPELPQEGSLRAGRIPGAVNIYFEENVHSDGTFKSISDLQQIYSSKKVTADKEIITYCRMGHRATLIWFVLSKLLLYKNVKLYDGSWIEWGNLVNVPIKK